MKVRFHATLVIFLLVLPRLAFSSLIPGHHYSAEKAFMSEDIPLSIRQTIENNKNAYYLGTQGHDLTYWAGWHGYTVNSDSEKMHEDGHSGKVIEEMIRELKAWKTKDALTTLQK